MRFTLWTLLDCKRSHVMHDFAERGDRRRTELNECKRESLKLVDTNIDM